MSNDELKKLDETLWKSADTLRANSDLKSSEYSTPVMGLIFLKFADNQYSNHEKDILQEYNELKGTRREKPVIQIVVEKCGFYLPDHARYDYLLGLPEDNEVDKAIKKAVEFIEEDGKTEEEFIEEIVAMNDELNRLNKEAKELEDVINHNIRQLAGD